MVKHTATSVVTIERFIIEQEKLHPEATAIHSNLGAALAGFGRFEEAVPEYKTALWQSPALAASLLVPRPS